MLLNGWYSNSSFVSIYSGVSQGSVLELLLFTIYINNLPSNVTSPMLMFVDDPKIFRSIQNDTDCIQLQSDINKLLPWSSIWQLNFNVSKCYLLHFGKSHCYSQYNIPGNIISSTGVIKDLGIYINKNLEFHYHSTSIAIQANYVLAHIYKSFECMDAGMLVQLYKSIVRPILEYGNVWGPHYVSDKSTIEKIQIRRATKINM